MSSPLHCAVRSEIAAASSYTTRSSSRKGSQTLPRFCPSLQGASRKSKPGSGICSPWFGTMFTILRSPGLNSLKAGLPALVPNMSYDGMAVADGQAAGLAWESLVRGGLDQAECECIRKALLAYCGQDTMALVRLLETLRQIPFHSENTQ
jgi:hypothetical protein